MPFVEEYYSDDDLEPDLEPEIQPEYVSDMVDTVVSFEPPCDNLMEDFVFINIKEKNKDKFIFFSDRCILLLSYRYTTNDIMVEKIMNHKILKDLNNEKYEKIIQLKNYYLSIEDNPTNKKLREKIYNETNDLIVDMFGDYGYDSYEKATEDYIKKGNKDLEEINPDSFWTNMHTTISEIINLRDKGCINYYLGCVLKNMHLIIPEINGSTKVVLVAEDYSIMPYFEGTNIDMSKFAKLIKAYNKIGFIVSGDKDVLFGAMLDTPERREAAESALDNYKTPPPLEGGKKKKSTKRKSTRRLNRRSLRRTTRNPLRKSTKRKYKQSKKKSSKKSKSKTNK